MATRTVTYNAMKIAHANGGDVGTRSKALRGKIRRLHREGNNPVASFLKSQGKSPADKGPYPEKWPLTVARIVAPTVGKSGSGKSRKSRKSRKSA